MVKCLYRSVRNTFTNAPLHIAEPLTEEQIEEKEVLQKEGFEHWSKRDFQQLVKAYEAHGK
jgi:hypothetical protein